MEEMWCVSLVCTNAVIINMLQTDEWLLLSVRVLAVLLCIITVRLTPIVLPVLAPEGYVAPPTLLVKTTVQFSLCSLLAILCSSHILWLLTSVRDIKISALAFHCV